MEVDRRVRLVANQVHALVTSNVKKKLAPVLKDIIGPWLLSMHDQSKDIVGVAKGSFEVRDMPFFFCFDKPCYLYVYIRQCLLQIKELELYHFAKRKF